MHTGLTAGESWSQRIDGPGRSEQSSIPTAVWSAIAKLKSIGGSAGSLEVSTTNGDARVEASPAGPDGSVAVVLGSERPELLPAALRPDRRRQGNGASSTLRCGG